MPKAVSMAEVFPGVIQITMQDRVNKNMFSNNIAEGLIASFDHIRGNQGYRAVILCGYDTYFSSGAGKDTLLDLQRGQGQFDDTNLYRLALDCEIPVISAMQGHGIGGGFVFGLSADCVVLSRESIYTTNFMQYGFTPGMGATYLLPKKLGLSLSEEMLLAARPYRGFDLEKRGVPFPVLPREDVVTYAQSLARDLAEKPRSALMLLKEHLVRQIKLELPEIIERELAMHRVLFRNPEVKSRIETSFGFFGSRQ